MLGFPLENSLSIVQKTFPVPVTLNFRFSHTVKTPSTLIFKAYSIVNWRSFFWSTPYVMIAPEWSPKDHHDSEAGDEEHEQLLTLLDPPFDLLHLQDVAHLKIRLEIEFLDINLTKESSPFSSMLFTVSSTGGFYRKPYSTVDLKLQTIKSAKKENSSPFMNSVLQNRITRVENQEKTRVWEDSNLCSETSIKTTVQELHESILG